MLGAVHTMLGNLGTARVLLERALALEEERLRLGYEIRTGVRVTGIEERDGRVAAVVTDAGSVPTDLVVLGLVVRPNTALAAAAGLPLGTTGGIRVDRRMRVPGMQLAR